MRGVVEAKTRTVQPFDEIESRACDVGQGEIVDQDVNAFQIHNPVAFLLGIEIELILKPGASASDHRDTQPLVRAEAFLACILRTISIAFGVSFTSGSEA